MAEPIYKINFTVDRAAPSVTPTDVQPAGYYGDDRVALVTFTLGEVLDGHRYRIEVVDGNGAYDITELLDAVDRVVSYTIPVAWTAAGTAAIRLVEIEIGEDGTETSVMHYPPARLLFNDRDNTSPMGDVLPQWQSVMTRAENASKRVEAAAEVIENAEDAAEMASQALKEAGEALKRVHGTNRIYVGSGDMPDDCNVQIDPSGEGVTFENNVLWECQGDLVLMAQDAENETGLQTIELSQKVSEQKSGVVLVFSGVNSDDFGVPSTPSNKWFNSFFIPRSLASLRENGGLNFLLTGGAVFTNIGAKYIYIHDDKIVGYGNNNRAGTSNGITYDNSKFCLRYVIGV